MSSGFFCTACAKTYSCHSSLRLHVKKFHPDSLDEIAPNKSKYECEYCLQTFTNERVYNKHMKAHRSTLKCPLCEFNNTQPALIDHFKTMHNIDVKVENLQFKSIDEFNVWKKQTEDQHKVLFTNNHGTMKTSSYSRTIYNCHRTGYYKTKGHGERHMKTTGTKKINAFCPAEIILQDQNGMCTVKYTSTHIGHENELKHIHLSDNERLMLAGKLSAKIPIADVLDDVRDSLYNSKLERIHLLTKQDLRNIASSYNLKHPAIRHPNDAQSVELWIDELKNNGCVPYYKPQNVLCPEYSFLKEEDFVLIIISGGQHEMLSTYGSDCICLDSTHGLNGYGFQLHTLLVLNSAREGFPCAFLISNRSDEQVCALFFMCIKNRCAQKIQPKVFMSDMADSYYNAWVKVMDPPEFRLYCSWHVDQAWRKNLPKINTYAKQIFVYKKLRLLLEETNVETFQIMIRQFIECLMQDDDTKQFGSYFQSYYFKKAMTWAYCYRMNAGLNTNMHLERMHKTLKHLYLDGKNTKRLDICIHSIMKYVKDKLFDMLIMFNKGKITSKIKILRSRHKASEDMDLSMVLVDESGEFNVCSKSSIYLIQDNNSSCSCSIICTKCEACIHKYSCTCIDYAIQWNMCKHIHLVQRYKQTNPEVISKPEEKIDLDVDKEVSSNIITSIIDSVSKKVEDKTTEASINELRYSFEEALKKISSNEKYDATSKHIFQLHKILDSIDSPKKSILMKSSTSTYNKNVTPQRRLFSTKKGKVNKRSEEKENKNA